MQTRTMKKKHGRNLQSGKVKPKPSAICKSPWKKWFNTICKEPDRICRSTMPPGKHFYPAYASEPLPLACKSSGKSTESVDPQCLLGNIFTQLTRPSRSHWPARAPGSLRTKASTSNFANTRAGRLRGALKRVPRGTPRNACEGPGRPQDVLHRAPDHCRDYVSR